jgi:hypothetical protein
MVFFIAGEPGWDDFVVLTKDGAQMRHPLSYIIIGTIYYPDLGKYMFLFSDDCQAIGKADSLEFISGIRIELEFHVEELRDTVCQEGFDISDNIIIPYRVFYVKCSQFSKAAFPI